MRPRLYASDPYVVRLQALPKRLEPKRRKFKPRGKPWPKGVSGNPKGCPKGIPRKKPASKRELRRQAIAASGLTPLEFLLSVVRDAEVHMDYRINAAKAAAPYVHRKMPIAIDGGDPNKPIVFEASALQGLTVQEKMTLLSLFEKMALDCKGRQAAEKPLLEGVARKVAEVEDNDCEEQEEQVQQNVGHA
jgi:hypothetical protein